MTIQANMDNINIANFAEAVAISRREPGTSIEDIAKCFRHQFDEAELNSLIRELKKGKLGTERGKEILCEKCGEPTGRKMVGDEVYDFCADCNWTTN